MPPRCFFTNLSEIVCDISMKLILRPHNGIQRYPGRNFKTMFSLEKTNKNGVQRFKYFFWANKKHCGITFLISENNLIKKNTFRFAGSVSKRSLFASVITCLTDVSWLNDHKHEADFTMGRKAAISQRQ